MIERAVETLKLGGLLGFPTETVYGLAADASNPAAVRKIFTAKGRPSYHPLIVHIADISQLNCWAREIPSTAIKLAEWFWPGPVTLILKKHAEVLDLVTGGQDTVGIRIPAHPMAVAVLKGFGGGVAAPSANKFGRISATTAVAVKEELGDAVDYILDGGACVGGIESTIIDCSQENPVILRPGLISQDEIREVVQANIKVKSKISEKVRVSGSHQSHYAPKTPTRLVLTDKVKLEFEKCTENEFPIALVTYSKKINLKHKNIKIIKMPSETAAYAHDLYSVLRNLDHGDFASIWVESVPDSHAWAAIKDRLQRASSSRNNS